MSPKSLFSVLAILLVSHASCWIAAQDFESFEARQGHPLDRMGSILLAVNSPKGTLAVFDLVAGVPVLREEIPVGVEPISVRARNASEAWVVNEVSDSLSIVDDLQVDVPLLSPTRDQDLRAAGVNCVFHQLANSLQRMRLRLRYDVDGVPLVADL